MRDLTAADAAHVLEDATSWAMCIKVFEDDSDAERMTAHDADIEVNLDTDPLGLNGTYSTIYTFSGTEIRGTNDLAVDNMETDVLLETLGVTRQQIRAGIYDNVRYVLFIVNWRDPTNSGIVIKRGVVGNVKDFLESLATFELRGFKQYLAQTITDAAGPTCRYTLGDAKCGVDLTSYEQTGEVTGIVNQRLTIESSLDGSDQDAGWFTGGVLTWSSGSNVGLSIEVKTDSGGGDLAFFEPVPYDISIGDTFALTPGCNKTHAVVDGVSSGDCGDKFGNIVNFGGEPFMPSEQDLFELADKR